MKFTGERFIPEADLDDEIQIEHFQRYQAIVSLVKGKTVLDAASGTGYGTNIIAANAACTFGLEIDQETITYARKTNDAQKLNFCQGSIAQLPFKDNSIDVVVSFETIEHVDENIQELFIKEVKRVLAPEGILIISTPNKLIYSDRPRYHNEYHIKEFYRDEFESFLKPHFKQIQFFEQITSLSYLIYNASTNHLKQQPLGDEKVQKGKYVIALCSDQHLSEKFSVNAITIDPRNKYQQKTKRIIELQGEIEGKNQDIKNVWDEVYDRDQTVTNLAETIKNNAKELQEKQQTINKMQKQLEQLKPFKNEAENLRDDINLCRKELEHIHSTKGWKLLQIFHNIKNKIF